MFLLSTCVHSDGIRADTEILAGVCEGVRGTLIEKKKPNREGWAKGNFWTEKVATLPGLVLSHLLPGDLFGHRRFQIQRRRLLASFCIRRLIFLSSAQKRLD